MLQSNGSQQHCALFQQQHGKTNDNSAACGKHLQESRLHQVSAMFQAGLHACCLKAAVNLCLTSLVANPPTEDYAMSCGPWNAFMFPTGFIHCGPAESAPLLSLRTSCIFSEEPLSGTSFSSICSFCRCMSHLRTCSQSSGMHRQTDPCRRSEGCKRTFATLLSLLLIFDICIGSAKICCITCLTRQCTYQQAVLEL